MKALKTSFTILFVLASLAITSCNSDDDGGNDGNAGAGTITAKIDGTSFTSSEMLTIANQVTAGPSSTLTLQGTDFSGKGFNLIVNGFNGQGTYDIGGTNSVFVIANYVEGNATNPTDTQTWTAPYDNDSVRGEINISTLTTTNISGTFNFSCKNPNDSTIKNITEGSFNIPL